MPRPPRTRRIDAPARDRTFKPRGVPARDLERVGVSLDGLEALRLADLEGLYQEEAARRMDVSRATFARILTEARRSVASALVHGHALEIGGGPVARVRTRRWPCPVHGGPRRRGRGCRCRGARRDESEGERKR